MKAINKNEEIKRLVRKYNSIFSPKLYVEIYAGKNGNAYTMEKTVQDMPLMYDFKDGVVTIGETWYKPLFTFISLEVLRDKLDELIN